MCEKESNRMNLPPDLVPIYYTMRLTVQRDYVTVSPIRLGRQSPQKQQIHVASIFVYYDSLALCISPVVPNTLVYDKGYKFLLISENQLNK